jgi:hypothetical protein
MNCNCPNRIITACSLERPKRRAYGAKGWSRCWTFNLADGRNIDRYAIVSRFKRDLVVSPVGFHYNNTSTILTPDCPVKK